MITVGIYIQDSETLNYNRIDLFDDEKISVTSSIQQINDLSKTYTDFSQTFVVPASKQNNKIFRHWYDNSNDSPFSTLVKSNAFIEIDTISFRKGKIQLESANVVDGQPQDYSITFIGILGNLKDTFAGLFLKDLTDTTYDFLYDATVVKNKIVTTTTSGNVMFPLITSEDVWKYGSGYDISATGTPIRFNDLFPAIKLSAVFNMIETRFGINFDGTFLSDARFTNAYLYLKNAEIFTAIKTKLKINWTSESVPHTPPVNDTGFTVDLATDKIIWGTAPATILFSGVTYNFVDRDYSWSIVTSNAGVPFTLSTYKNGELLFETTEQLSTVNGVFNGYSEYDSDRFGNNDYYEFFVNYNAPLTFTSGFRAKANFQNSGGFITIRRFNVDGASQTTPSYFLPINKYFPEIKIEDFFSGLLKMFNLTCYSIDGINYTIEQLESYYGAGSDIDITKYVLQDKKALNRVKTYKKINFEYEKSESFINVAFESNAGIPYGTLRYVNNPPTEGEEYAIKLPFEDLNFLNLSGLLQVGYCLNTSYSKYIPKPIILYDYNPSGLTTAPQFYFNTNTSGGVSTPHTVYKAFGQETLISSVTYGLNFPTQKSTLTNEIVTKGLYEQYYSAYFANIFNYKARLIKVSAILPTSILTSLKLNDNIIIRDAKYLINTMNTDLTTGEVQFELLTDQRL